MRELCVVIGVGGMGEAIAHRCGADKNVLLADHSLSALDRVADALRVEGMSVTTRHVDVSSRRSVVELVEFAASMGPVVQVVHTAGVSPVQASADAVLRVDLLGVANSLEQFGKIIEPGGSGVVISSMAGWLSANQVSANLEYALANTPAQELLDLPLLSALSDSQTAYGIAKRGNQLRVCTASADWGKRGACVNSISPGIIATSMGQEELSGESGARMAEMIAESGTGRIGTPTDVANVAAFLLGPESSFITGTDVLVDGGVIGSLRAGKTTP